MGVRRIASNYIWSRERGFEAHPVAVVGDGGDITSFKLLADPDREPMTEFFSGVLVGGFPSAWRETFAEMMASPCRTLDTLLRERVGDGGCVVVISGLDYATMSLTPRSQLLKIR